MYLFSTLTGLFLDLLDHLLLEGSKSLPSVRWLHLLPLELEARLGVALLLNDPLQSEAGRVALEYMDFPKANLRVELAILATELLVKWAKGIVTLAHQVKLV